MTTLQQSAMRKALEALETCSYGDYSAKHVVDPSFDGDAVEAAIESLNAALAQQVEQAKPAAPADHEVRELVNRLTAIAREFHGTQQLRERIANEVRPFTFVKPVLNEQQT